MTKRNWSLDRIYRAPQPVWIEMSVALRHIHRLVPQQLLHLVDRNPRPYQLRGEVVPEIMRAEVRDARIIQRRPKAALYVLQPSSGLPTKNPRRLRAMFDDRNRL